MWGITAFFFGVYTPKTNKRNITQRWEAENMENVEHMGINGGLIGQTG
jgi:hypothetical protein